MVKLGDICCIVSGTTPKSSCPEYWDGDINWITPAELTENSDVIYESQRKITKQAVKDSSLKPFPAGTVLLSSRAPIGKVAIAGIEMYCNQGFKNLICSESIYNRYLFHFLKSKTDYLNSLGRGATFKEISKSIVENIEVPLPSLEEQRAIAAQLDKISDLIAKRRAQLDKLDLLVKARFVEMFGNKNYCYQELISLIEDGAGLSYGIVQPGDDGTGDMGIIRPIDFIDGEIDIKSIKYIDRNIANGFRKTELTGKELLITVRGSTGSTALTDKRFCGMNVTRGVAVIRYDCDKINPVYLNEYLRTDESQRYIQEHTRGATLKQINLADLRIQQILVPPRLEQEEFAEFVVKINRIKTRLGISFEKLEMIKKALMQTYFG